MKRKGCLIVCPVACRTCSITPCDDRLADEVTEAKADVAAAAAVDMTVTELYQFMDGTPIVVKTPNPYEDRREDVQEAEAQAKCGMRSDLICRHCAEEDCSVRKAPRTY